MKFSVNRELIGVKGNLRKGKGREWGHHSAFIELALYGTASSMAEKGLP